MVAGNKIIGTHHIIFVFYNFTGATMLANEKHMATTRIPDNAFGFA